MVDRSALPQTHFDWTIDWDTGEIKHDEITRRAQEQTAEYITYCRELADGAPTDRTRAYYERQIAYADEYEAHYVKVLTKKAAHLAWERRVYVLGDRSAGVELDDAQIKGLTTDGRL